MIVTWLAFVFESLFLGVVYDFFQMVVREMFCGNGMGRYLNGIKLRNEHTPKIILHEEFISSRREDFIDDVFHSMPNRR